jgi:hypothetical protein
MQLNEEKIYNLNFFNSQKCGQEKVNYIQHSTIVNNNQIINKTSTIKGNLFRNTSRSIKFNSKDDDALLKYAAPKNFSNFSINFNKKDYKNIINSNTDFLKNFKFDNLNPFINNEENNINNDINNNNFNLDITNCDQRKKKDDNKDNNNNNFSYSQKDFFISKNINKNIDKEISKKKYKKKI